jgi:thioredoxin-related protein
VWLRDVLLTVLLTAVAFAAPSSSATAAELLMFEDAGCPYCRRWHAEIGPGYGKSAEGQRAPLRRIDIRAELPQGVQLSRRVTITPTFVLVDQGREIGRVAGYVGAEFFYEVLDEVMRRLPAASVGEAK